MGRLLSLSHVFVIGALVMMPLRAFAAHRCDLSDQRIPESLKLQLRSAYPTWQIVQLEDLRDADQRIWRKERPSCPVGFARGHFVSPATESFAISLIRKTSNSGRTTYQQILLAAESDGDKYKIIPVIPPPGATSVLWVIWKTNLEEDSPLRMIDTIVVEVIEGGSVGFTWKNGAFVKKQLSE